MKGGKKKAGREEERRKERGKRKEERGLWSSVVDVYGYLVRSVR